MSIRPNAGRLAILGFASCSCGTTTTDAVAVADRPGFSAAPTVVGVRAIQVEAGANWTHVDRRDASLTLPGAILRAGVDGRLEFDVGAEHVTDPARGEATTVAGCGAKVLLHEDDGFAIGVSAMFRLRGDDARREREGQSDLRVLSSVDLDASTTVLANLALSVAVGAGDDDPSAAASVSLGRALSPTWSMFLEWYALDLPHARDHLSCGAQLRIEPRTLVDLSLGWGLDRQADRAFVGIGVVHAF
ncbi:MAG: transporter [Planctomycetota bacterium]